MRVLVNLRGDRPRDEQGAVAILTGVLVVFLAVVSAFSIDMGIAYKSRMELRTAADAGALAAAGVFAGQPGITDCATLAASAYAEADAEAQSVGGENRDGGVTGDPITVECVEGALEVTYTVHGSTSQLFGGLATDGGDIAQERTATAVVDVPSAVTGLRPLALCAWEDFDPHQKDGFLTIPIPDTSPAATPDPGGGGPKKDTDKGGLPDADEVLLGSNPNNPADDTATANGDADSDGLINKDDAAPFDPDQDDDGIPDGSDANPTSAAFCPDLKTPGNWWTIDCPGEGNSGESASGGLAAAIRDGCDNPVEIVPGQPDTGPLALSSHLTGYCAADHPSSCLGANTGNFSGSDNSGAIEAFTDLAQSQKAVIFPIFCGYPWCTPVATTADSGNNTIYPVYRLISATVCGFHLKNSTVNVTSGDCAGAPSVSGNDSELVLSVHSVIVSGVTTPSTCALGASCDSGARRVLMVK